MNDEAIKFTLQAEGHLESLSSLFTVATTPKGRGFQGTVTFLSDDVTSFSTFMVDEITDVKMAILIFLATVVLLKKPDVMTAISNL